MRQCTGSIDENTKEIELDACSSITFVKLLTANEFSVWSSRVQVCLLCKIVVWVKMFFNDHKYTIVVHVVRE